MQLIIKLALLLALVCCCHAGYKVTTFYGTGPTCSGNPADISYVTSPTSCTGPTPCQGVYNAASSKETCVSTLPTAPAAKTCWMNQYSGPGCAGTRTSFNVFFNSCRLMYLDAQWSIYNHTATTFSQYICNDSACKSCSLGWVRTRGCLENSNITC